MSRSANQHDDRDVDRAAGNQPGAMLGMQLPGAGLRLAATVAIRVRALVADLRAVGRSVAAGRMSDVRSGCRTGNGTLRVAQAHSSRSHRRGMVLRCDVGVSSMVNSTEYRVARGVCIRDDGPVRSVK